MQAEISQVGLELLRGLKYHAGHAETPSGFSVSGNIIDVDGFLGSDFADSEGFLVDDWIGFTGAEAAGVDPAREKAKEIVSLLHVSDVDGIGV